MQNKTKQSQINREIEHLLDMGRNAFSPSFELPIYKKQLISLLGYKFLSENIENNSGDLGYELNENYLYKNLLVNKDTVIERLKDGINQISRGNINLQSSDVFYDLFDLFDFETFNENDKWVILIDVIERICNLTTIGKLIIFLTKYSNSLKYNNHKPTNDIIKLMIADEDKVENIYDPFAEDGTLLAEIGNRISVKNYYGQYPIKDNCIIAKINLLTNNVNYRNIFIKQNDIIELIPWDVKFDLCVTITPFGRKDNIFNEYDARFQPYAPKRASELAYLLDMFYHLEEDGTLKIIVPDRVLRTSPNKKIIQYLADNKFISTIIGLPGGLFETTAISTALLILNKSHLNKGIYYLNLRNVPTKYMNKRIKTIVDIDKYTKILSNKEIIELTSKNATLEDIHENNYNLAINRYIDQEKLEKIDIKQTITNIKSIKKELKQVDEELNKKNWKFIQIG